MFRPQIRFISQVAWNISLQILTIDAYGYIADNEIAKGILGLSSDNALEIYGSKVDLRGDLESIFGGDLVSYQDQKSLTEISEATDRVGQIRNLSTYFLLSLFVSYFGYVYNHSAFD